MARLRLATWNVAWFARLFDRRDRLMADAAKSAMPGVTRHRQADAIAAVLARLDADLIAVIEAPNSGRTQSSVTALERFAAAYRLRQRAAVSGFESPTHQEISLLFDPDRIAAEHAPIGAPADEVAALAGLSPLAAPRFDSVFAHGGTLCRFSKPPLEATVVDRGSGLSLRLIAVHLKSHGAETEGQPSEALAHRIAANQALQRAQAAWIRARVEEHLAVGEALAVLGDFNDGPAGLAEGPSSVEIVAGEPGCPDRRLISPFLIPAGASATALPASARLGGAEALVDFILLSPELAAAQRASRIWHPRRNPDCRADAALAAALEDASDHFPVSVDLDPAAVSTSTGRAGGAHEESH